MINKLLEYIENDKLITKKMFGNPKKYDDLNDKRDLEIFEDKWIELEEKVSEAEDNIDDKLFDIYDESSAVIDKILETTFIKTMQITGDDDLAACVSDDFELILKGYFFKVNDAWLITLFNYYVENKFPHKKLKLTKKSYDDIFNKIK